VKDPCLSFYCSITVIVNPSSVLIGIEVFQVNSEREDLTDAKLPLFLNTFFSYSAGIFSLMEDLALLINYWFWSSEICKKNSGIEFDPLSVLQ
jgi:hypothetical protein